MTRSQGLWTVATLDTVVQRVVTFLGQISNAENMTLSQVQPVASEIQRLGNSLEKELDNLYGHPN